VASQNTPDTPDTFGHLPHPWIGHTVRDIACNQTGQLTAVVQEPAGFASDRPLPPRLAYIRGASGVEWSTAVSNLELAT
jgi:hypothetical protein